MELRITPIGEDYWGRKLFKNVDSGRIYAVVDGWYYSTTQDGEPDCPLRRDLTITVI